MKTNNKRLRITATINYSYIEEGEEYIRFDTELNEELNEETIDEELEELVRKEFLDNYYGSELCGDIDVYDLEYEEIESISPMKVMELEGEKTLFDLKELDANA